MAEPQAEGGWKVVFPDGFEVPAASRGNAEIVARETFPGSECVIERYEGEYRHGPRHFAAQVARAARHHQKLCATPKVVYADYIRTEAWRQKAAAAKRRANYRCQLCNREGPLNAHHRTYERLGHERESDITVLCERCHEKFHDVLGVAS